MIERKDKRYVSCPVCGRHLMKCQGQCNIDITCGKCNREIVVIVDEERVANPIPRFTHDTVLPTPPF